MGRLKIMLIIIIIIFVLTCICILLRKYEEKKTYTIRDIEPRRVDEKGKELCYSIGFYFWQQKKLQLIKQYYGSNSIIEDRNWRIDYKITDVRGPYRKETGLPFECELEFKVASVQAKDEITIEGIAVKVYAEGKCRFNIEGYRTELQDVYQLISQKKTNVGDIEELLYKLYFMQNTNLMRYKDLVKIKEAIEECISEGDRKKMRIYNFISKLLVQYDINEKSAVTLINQGQLNMANDNAKIDATQNYYMNNE